MNDWRRGAAPILQSLGVAVIAVNLAGTVTSWNKAATTLYGWSEHEAVGAPVMSLLPSAIRTEDTDNLVAAVATGVSTDGEWLVRGRTGEIIPVRVHIMPLRAEDGSLIGAIGVAVSIATEIESRRAGEASERRFRALVTHTADGIAVLDAKGIVTYASPSLCEFINASESDVVGTRGFDLLEPVDAGQMEEQVAAAVDGSVVGPIPVWLKSAGPGAEDFEGYRTDLSADPDVLGVVWNLRDVSATRNAQRFVARSEERLQALSAGSSDVTMVVKADGLLSYVSPSVERVFGYRPDELVGTQGSGLIHAEDLAGTDSVGDSILQAGALTQPERFRLRHQNGSWRRVEVLFSDLFDNPAVAGLVANIRDTTEQHLADEAYRQSEVRYRSVVETAAEGIWMHDLRGRTTFANRMMASLLGTDVADLEQRSLFDFVEPADHALARSKNEQTRRGKEGQYEFTFRKSDGTALEALISTSPQRHIDGSIVGVVKMVTDIGDRKRAEAKNLRTALEDSLTGLASRALIVDRLTQTLEHQRRTPSLAAVLFLDLDNFKVVNDSLGHDAGDQLLCEVAQRIRAEARSQDTVGRFGGDEFVVVLEDLEDASDALAIAERISHALRQPKTVEGTDVSCRASIGVALTPALDAGSLLRDADIAMYGAKELGGDRCELFNFALRARAVARLALEADLRTAIEQRQMCLHYQPVVDLDGRVAGFEALARWNHPTRGRVSPNEFIPLAEATGLIIELGAWTLDQACRDLARWRRRPGREELTVSVNLSGRQLAQADVAGVVAATLAAHDLAPGSLCLEITESVLMDDNLAATAALTTIHDLGINLSVDDFGTGYSSLLYLRRFPVDALKLDRFFVAGLDRNSQDPAIVRAVIDLAHSLDLYAVAEGVETAGQLEALRAMGCDYIQGFLFSPAVPAGEVEALLSRDVLVPTEQSSAFVSRDSPAPSPQVTEDDPLPTHPITVLIVDDSDRERGLLYSRLEASGRFRVVGEASDGSTAVELASRTKPDLVLLEVVMPGMDGLQTLPLLLRASPTSRVAILSGYVSRGLRNRAINGGAVTVLEKGAAFQGIVAELRAVMTVPEPFGTRSGRLAVVRDGPR